MMQSALETEGETSSHRRRGRDVPSPESASPLPRTSAATAAAPAARAFAGNPLLFAQHLDLLSLTRVSWLCRLTREAVGRTAYKTCLTHGAGVPDNRRLEYWMCKLNVKQEMADKVASAKRKSPGHYRDVYEACLYGDEQARAGDNGLAVIKQPGESADGDRGADRRAMPPPMLPRSGWRALSRNGAEGEISRDVGRTFPRQELFKSRNGPGQNMLANVLKACLQANPDVGYCQGMNFVAGSLLLACALQDPAVKGGNGCGGSTDDSGDGGRDGVSTASFTSSSWEEGDELDCGRSERDDSRAEWRSGPAHQEAEKRVFWLMLALTSRLSGVGSGLGMRELWLPGVPQLKVRVFQFDKLMLRELPRLYNHFKAKQLQLEVLVSQWFLTLFSYSLSPPMLLRVLDLTFTDGWKAMFRFGLARLRSVQDILCKLELEGVSSFLRNFRDGGDFSAPPSPPRHNASWYNRGGKGWGGLGVSASGAEGDVDGGEKEKATIRQCSSIQLLRKTGEVKLTRSMLNSLQQDFAVQLLKEHLHGEGQWLTRYGDAPDPTPGAGGGVIGGDRDGDVGFMGVEAMTRMMLSDTKLLQRLKDKLAQMAAPLQADARIFQDKIAEASDRLEEATRERSSLSSELLGLKEDMDALRQRKKLVADQMHLLLVQFERDSAAYRAEKGGAQQDSGSGSGSGGGTGGDDDRGVVRVSSASSSSSSSEGGGGLIEDFQDLGGGSGSGVGGFASDVVSFLSEASNRNGVIDSSSRGTVDNGGSGTLDSDGGGMDVGDERLGIDIEQRERLHGGGGGEEDVASSGRCHSPGGGGVVVERDDSEDRCRSASSSSSIRSRSSSDSGGCDDNDGPLKDEIQPQQQQQQQQLEQEQQWDTKEKRRDALDLPETMWNMESDHSFLQHLPPPPSWDPGSADKSRLGEVETGTADLSPPPPSRVNDSINNSRDGFSEESQHHQHQRQDRKLGQSCIRSRSPRPEGVSPRPGRRPLSPMSSPKGGFFMGDATKDESQERGRASPTTTNRTTGKEWSAIRSGPGVGRGREGFFAGRRGDNDDSAWGIEKVGGGESGEAGKATPWKRLAKWVGSSGGSGGGKLSAGTTFGVGVGVGSYSSWFSTSRPTSAGSGEGGRGAAARERGEGRGEAATMLSSVSPPRWARRRGRKEHTTSTLMEELYQDLEQLRRRLEDVQASIDDKSDMYATLYHSYTRALTDAEEAEELKRALSSQMIQLLFEQEKRLEGYLRECITFDGVGAGLLAEDSADAIPERADKTDCVTVNRGSGGGGGTSSATVVTGVAVSGDGKSSPDSTGSRGDEGVYCACDDDGDDGGFEKVDAWMADGFDGEGKEGDGGGGGGGGGGCVEDAE